MKLLDDEFPVSNQELFDSDPFGGVIATIRDVLEAALTDEAMGQMNDQELMILTEIAYIVRNKAGMEVNV